MVLAWLTLRKMIRIAKTYRITSIADFIASRYGKSPLLAGAVTLITVVGIVPYIALQLKAVASGYALLTTPLGTPLAAPLGWWRDSTFYFALALAGFTMVFGARHLDSAEKHEGMVAAIAFESVVSARLPGRRRLRDLGRLPRPGRHLRARPRRPRAAPAAHPYPGAGPEVRLRAVVRADWAVDAVDHLPPATVPDDGGRERRRAARQARGLGIPLVPAADQPVRPADRPGRPAPLRARPHGRRQFRPLPAAGPGAAGAGPVRLRGRAVGSHRDGDRRGDRGLDHGLQRPGHADASAHSPLRRARPRRPGPAAAGYPAGRDRRRTAARLRLLRDCRRGLCAGQHRPHQFRRGGPVRAGDAGRVVLERRHAQRCTGRPAAGLPALGLYADAALGGEVGLATGRLRQRRALGPGLA